jgi:heme exporter protein A
LSLPLLECVDLTCNRGGRPLWRGVSTRLEGGMALLVSGANGIGKSSLLRILAGLLPPAYGRIARGGTVALVDETLALDTDQPLAQALAFWSALDGGGPNTVMTALDRLGIAHLAAVPVRILSTGQKKRASLARLLASDAPLWLLDEPGNGLDRDGIALLEGLIAAHRVAGGAVVVASHLPLALSDPLRIDLSDFRAKVLP